MKKIHFVVGCPWSEGLGVSQVSIGLSKALAEAGYECSHWSTEELDKSRNRLNKHWWGKIVAQKAREHIASCGNKYDVIQVEERLLWFPREDYQYKGMLIAKSNGLLERYLPYMMVHQPLLEPVSQNLREKISHALFKPAYFERAMKVRNGLRNVDSIHVLNESEEDLVLSRFQTRARVRVVPNALDARMLQSLSSIPAAEGRVENLVFIGSWISRKGSCELPLIISKVIADNPDIQIHLLGTGVSRQGILAHFDPKSHGRIVVKESFSRNDLPTMLPERSLGIYLSYAEGSPLGIIEMLTAAIPVVAWDIPGVRELVHPVLPELLCPVGQIRPTVACINQILALPETEQRRLRIKSRETVMDRNWKNSAAIFAEDIESFTPGR